jgi:AcrR family transcriptional regulator/GNAT superfamily N-acetyltransferase
MSVAAIKYDRGMSRWEPNARGRLEQAALELYLDRGFEQTAVAEIAKRAGLTERTFFRHFADKREVLFAGSGFLQEFIVSAVADAPDSAAPIDAVASALEAAGALLQERREYARQRHAVIAANAELRERELIKLASIGSAMAEVLRRRGVKDPAASLTAEAGIAVFRIAFEGWISGTSQRDLPQFIRASLNELRAVTAGSSWIIRRATSEDGDFLADMLVEAVNWSPEWKKKSRNQVLSTPRTAHYIAGWPRDSDLGVIAGADGERIGAAWLRFLPAADPGYGFIAPDVPELTIGVAGHWRGRGVGRALLRAIAGQARSVGIRQISLSVERKNFAQKLYASEGYQIVDSGDAGSDTMVKDLAAGHARSSPR